MLEIERKFLIKHISFPLDEYPHKDILQGYFRDKAMDKQMRLRKKGDTYYITHKTWEWLIREEIENEITKEEFDEQWKLVGERFLQKTRYHIPYWDYTIELDVFKDDLQWLIFAEVEFPSEQAAHEFVVPEWFDEELTYNEEAKNGYLAKHGIGNSLKKLMQ